MQVSSSIHEEIPEKTSMFGISFNTSNEVNGCCILQASVCTAI
ncbi:TPA: hypothetical protein ACOQ31_005816 [Bacillus cereus]|nr:hypothetical protein [Bacillus cereus]